MGRTECYSKVVLFASTILAAYAFPLLAHLLQLRVSGDLPNDAQMPHITHDAGRFIFRLTLVACGVASMGILAGCATSERSSAAKYLITAVIVAQLVVCYMIISQAHTEMDQCRVEIDEVVVQRTPIIGVLPNGQELAIGMGVSEDVKSRPDELANLVCRRGIAHLYCLCGSIVAVLLAMLGFCGVGLGEAAEADEFKEEEEEHLSAGGYIAVGKIVE